MTFTDLRLFIERSQASKSSINKAVAFVAPLEGANIKDVPAFIEELRIKIKSESYANVLNPILNKNVSERTAENYFGCFLKFYNGLPLKDDIPSIPSKNNNSISRSKDVDISNLFSMAGELKKHESNQVLDKDIKKQIQIIMLKKLRDIVDDCISSSEK
ncbi:hypothetical protein [Shewanella sp. AC91-MNA-CIBAN-0169]|uniref:hypothetical protein n=1 Tax=Shewanella sp. AC91-MNA-CIBAN-0169 TaxID=3140466 RepID=UPI003332F2B2